MKIIHHYVNNVFNSSATTGKNCPVSGAGENPSSSWLKPYEWYYVQDKSESPGPEYVWQFSEPNYLLVDDFSVPQGEWIIPEPIPPSEDILRRYEMENAYLEATRGLMLLAGEIVEEGTWPKLEDVQFMSIRRAAMTNNLIVAVELLDTLLYTFPQIIRYGGTWEEIEYHV